MDSRTVTIQFAEIARLAGFAPGPYGRLNLPATQETADALARAASEILLQWMPGDAPVDVTLTCAAPVLRYLMVALGLHGTARPLSYAAPNAPVLRVWSNGSDT